MSRTPIQHTLWVFNTGAQQFHAHVNSAIQILNNEYLPNCVGDAGTAFTVTAAVAREAPGATITPGAFDAVVFLVRDTNHSLGVVNLKFTLNPNTAANRQILGNTWLGGGTIPGGDLAEVFWDRLWSDAEAAKAIFHEAAHLKSGLGNAMHTQRPGQPHGGPGLQVLAAQGGGNPTPSWDDFELYTNAIARQVTLRTRIPP